MLSKRILDMEIPSLLSLRELAKGLEDVIYLNVGEPDYTTPRHIIEAAKEAMDIGYTHYPPDEGILELREAICNYYKEMYGADFSTGNVLITTGATQGIFAALMSLVERGDEVILPDPLYPGYLRSIILAEGRAVTVKQDEEKDFQIDLDELNEKITDKTKVLIIINPNNPTGAVLSKNTLRGIAEIVQDNNIVLISDEIYERFVYDGEFHSIVEFPEIQDKTIILNGFSKSYAMTGWRVGFAVGPEKYIKQMLKVVITSSLGVPIISQYAALKAITGSDEPVIKMVEDYRERRDALVKEVNKIKYFTLVKPKGAFYAFINTAKTGMNEVDLVKYLIKDARVLLSPGYPYFGPSGRNHVRVAYTVPKERIVEAITRIRESLEKI